MLRPRDLPSILQFANELASAFDERELVALARPSRSMWHPWVEAIFDALDELSLRRDTFESVRLPHLEGNADNARAEWAKTLAQPDDLSIQELLQTFGPHTVMILTVSCSQGISDSWKTLLMDVVRVYRTQAKGCGPVLALLTECQEFPPIDPGVGIRVRALWNAVRWEEVRLLIDSMLPENENALVRAWRVAVYSAASCSDPSVMALLCRLMPNSLSETANAVIEAKSIRATENEMPGSLFVPDQRWELPPAVVSDWIHGLVGGVTLERGTSLNIRSLKREDARNYIFNAIWREQVAGLLTVVMEMGFSIAQAVTNAVGGQWLGESPIGILSPDGRVNLEPAEVLDKLRGPPKTHVPKTLLQTLQLLRNTRNDLAHMRPVDYGRIRELWQKYDQARQLFGVSRAEATIADTGIAPSKRRHPRR